MNCPSCGAPVSSDATQCDHCGARLAMVACPSCFGMVFVGSKFCSHCGAAISREEVPAQTVALCPRCQVNMDAVQIGKENLRECTKCEGIWADTASLQKICEDREEQSAVLGTAAHLPEGDAVLETNIRYLPCPICKKFMNRVNFAHCSHVIVDVCSQHGTWFDKDELRRIVEFIRAGGFERARQEQIQQLEQKRTQLASAQTGGFVVQPASDRRDYNELTGGIASAAVDLIASFFFKR